MVFFTKNYLVGLGREQSNSWENILLNWIKDNWTLQNPALWNQNTNPDGVLFGSEYVGEFDFVCYSKILQNNGGASRNAMLGGRYNIQSPVITFIFNVRDYSVRDGDQVPEEVTNVMEFIEDLIDRNPHGLRSEGVRKMWIINMTNGDREINAQQTYELRFDIQFLIAKVNLE